MPLSLTSKLGHLSFKCSFPLEGHDNPLRHTIQGYQSKWSVTLEAIRLTTFFWIRTEQDTHPRLTQTNLMLSSNYGRQREVR